MSVATDIHRFSDLQAGLRAFDDVNEQRTVVVIASYTLDPTILEAHADALPAYEERALYLLFALRRPRARVVLVTALPVPETILGHYLACMPEIADARERLHLVSVDDPSPRPLAVKLLERPQLVERIRDLAGDPDRAFIMPFIVEQPESILSLRLGIPTYGIDYRFRRHGTKTGSRRMFAAAGVAHPEGVEGLRGIEDVRSAISTLRRRIPGLGAVVAKHDDGVFGEGNAILALHDLPPAGTAEEAAALDLRLRSLPNEWLDGLRMRGGIVEELLTGEEVRSPSAQVRIRPGHGIDVISTHDQVLGGPLGQTYVGCSFPAEAAYAPQIVEAARRVGERLAAEGAIGRFGVDFLAVRETHGWRVSALEINLREGGTSHPYGTLWLLTDGGLTADGARYVTARGQERAYFATDALSDPSWRGLRCRDLLRTARDLLYDPESETGIVLYMLRSLESEGRLAAVAIGESAEDANRRYLALASILDGMAAARSS